MARLRVAEPTGEDLRAELAKARAAHRRRGRKKNAIGAKATHGGVKTALNQP
jgi:hypothetical protein